MQKTMHFTKFVANLTSYKQQPNNKVQIAVNPKITRYF